MGPPSHQSTTWTCAKTYMRTWKNRKGLQREQSPQEKISHGHCKRQVDKPPGPSSHLNKPARRDLLKSQVAIGRDWGRNTTKPGCPDPSPHLPESISFIHSLASTVSLPVREKPSPTPWKGELPWILCRSQAIHKKLSSIKYCSCSRCTKRRRTEQDNSEQESLANEKM